jgi:tetratricopeptide (TPR) repeat protein
MRTLARSLTALALLWSASSPTAAQRASAEAERATRSYRTGWEMMKVESWADAERQFQQAIDIDPKFSLAHYALGRAHMALKKYAEAIQAYLKCRELYLARAGEQFSNQADAARYREDQILERQEALRLMQSTQSNAQTLSLSRQHLQNELRDLEEAKTRNIPTVIQPRVPFFVSLALGSAYFRAERFADAEREYKSAIDDNPRCGEAHNNLAVVYLTTGRFDDAERAASAAEKVGFKVASGLKDDIKKRKG